ncbi:hypothetical protein PH562_16485 [Rhizobium sp. CNPSo 4062]|uniref:hypothetical protein n=1 Tax=Rhizobium sp. CNPSo 4062 TaxID=3021410 RepID=UPI00254CB9C3|nr:hypothetical protein [Rhizobium sp. CNPSo 4062]MDK4703850.1 hypothetical protein [Rhizobium sp. CNPSo 4062]
MTEYSKADLDEARRLDDQGSDLMPRYSMKRMRDELRRAEQFARREALEEAALKVDSLRSVLNRSDGDITHARAFIKDLLRDLSSSIRSLSDSTPSLLQEQNANDGKEGKPTAACGNNVDSRT